MIKSPIYHIFSVVRLFYSFCFLTSTSTTTTTTTTTTTVTDTATFKRLNESKNILNKKHFPAVSNSSLMCCLEVYDKAWPF
jgi:hypothetical protein